MCMSTHRARSLPMSEHVAAKIKGLWSATEGLAVRSWFADI